MGGARTVLGCIAESVTADEERERERNQTGLR